MGLSGRAARGRYSGILVAATLVACGSDDGGGSGDGASSGEMTTGGEALDLPTVCEASCNKQQGCPSDLGFPSCYDACVGLAERFPQCEDVWVSLNQCMAQDDLRCDAQGYSATFAADCLALADQFGTCLSG
jgi:hypothetical protein